MHHRFLVRGAGRHGLPGLLAVALSGLPPPAAAGEKTIRCTSHGLRYQYCRADTDNRVRLTRSHGFFECRDGRNWGYDQRGVWVDDGCDGEFLVGRDSHDSKVAIGAAVVGLAAIAAIAATRSQQESTEVASWAVGSFGGSDEVEGVDVSLTILPGGSVSGRAGGRELSGRLSGDRLEAGRHVFRIARQGNGFLATDERDAGHRVLFRRSGSGY